MAPQDSEAAAEEEKEASPNPRFVRPCRCSRLAISETPGNSFFFGGEAKNGIKIAKIQKTNIFNINA